MLCTYHQDMVRIDEKYVRCQVTTAWPEAVSPGPFQPVRQLGMDTDLCIDPSSPTHLQPNSCTF